MSDKNCMYSVRVNGETVMAPSQAAAEAIAAALGGTVVAVSRKEALSAVREATRTPEYPPALSDMLALIKDTVVIEVDKAGLLEGSCWQVIARYDSKHEVWYTEVKNLVEGPTQYNQVTGEKYASIVHARWSYGKSCDIKCLRRGINGDDKFGNAKPVAAA